MEPLKDKFIRIYTEELTDRFANDPEFAFSAARTTPAELALKMYNSIMKQTANINSPAIKKALKACGIKPTYTAVREAFQVGVEAGAEA